MQMNRMLSGIHDRGRNSTGFTSNGEVGVRKKIPDETLRERDLEVNMQLNRQWLPRRVLITKEVVSFAFLGSDDQIDVIPLQEVEYVKVWHDFNSTGRRLSLMDNENSADQIFALQIATNKSGFNSGRSYYLSLGNKEVRDDTIRLLTNFYKAARKRAAASTQLERIQLKTRKYFESKWFQGFMALLIAGNFGCTIVESQFISELIDPGGGSSQLENTLNNLNIFFTVTFTIELMVNAFANWMWLFLRNPWSLLDTFVVAMSLLSVADSNQPTGIVRILRALRVIRLFGRVKKLRKIIDALSIAVVPVFNVFLILFLIMGIFAVVGVSAFSQIAPDEFEVFDKAFFTLFRVTGGDPWPSEPHHLHEDGKVNYLVFGYQFAYTTTVLWIIVQVWVAVLLDSFIGASVRMDEEEKVAKADRKLREQTLRNPMEPLLMRIAKDFSDNQDLSDRLQTLYKALDGDGSGGLDSEEFCIAIKKLDFKPRIHMTDSDFRSMTDDLKLCDAEGQLGAEEFERVMRRQIRHLAQSKLVLNTLDRSADEADFMLHGTLKLIFMEQTNTENRLDAIAQELGRISTAISGGSCSSTPDAISTSPFAHTSNSVVKSCYVGELTQPRGGVGERKSVDKSSPPASPFVTPLDDWRREITESISQALGGRLKEMSDCWTSVLRSELGMLERLLLREKCAEPCTPMDSPHQPAADSAQAYVSPEEYSRTSPPRPSWTRRAMRRSAHGADHLEKYPAAIFASAAIAADDHAASSLSTLGQNLSQSAADSIPGRQVSVVGDASSAAIRVRMRGTRQASRRDVSLPMPPSPSAPLPSTVSSEGLRENLKLHSSVRGDVVLIDQPRSAQSATPPPPPPAPPSTPPLLVDDGETDQTLSRQGNSLDVVRDGSRPPRRIVRVGGGR